MQRRTGSSSNRCISLPRLLFFFFLSLILVAQLLYIVLFYLNITTVVNGGGAIGGGLGGGLGGGDAAATTAAADASPHRAAAAATTAAASNLSPSLNGEGDHRFQLTPLRSMALTSSLLPEIYAREELCWDKKCENQCTCDNVGHMPHSKPKLISRADEVADRQQLSELKRACDERATFGNNRVSELYDVRALNYSMCDTPSGPWAPWTPSAFHKCIPRVLGELFGFSPGHLLLDIGSACGFKLAAYAEWFHVAGFGIDYNEHLVRIASARAGSDKVIGGRLEFCRGDVHRLHWLPSRTFDFALTVGVYTYSNTLQDVCGSIAEVIRALKIGGLFILTWNSRVIERAHHAVECVGQFNGSVTVESINERQLFGACAYGQPHFLTHVYKKINENYLV